jgi:predicted small secreted protein
MNNENHEPNTKMNTRLKRLAPVLLVTSLLAIGVGCNTAHGFGKDASNTGDAI